MLLENAIVTAEDWEVFCAEYEDWLRNVWTPFLGVEEDEMV